MFRLGDKLPDGSDHRRARPACVDGAGRAAQPLAPQTYTDRFSMPPIYPAYHMAQSMFGLKTAWEKAQAKKGGGAADQR